MRKTLRALAAGFDFDGARRIKDYLFENDEVIEVAFAAVRADPTQSLRAVQLNAFGDFDEPCALQNLQMTAQITICQSTQTLQIRERDARGMRDEGGEQAKARALVDDPI